MTPADWLRDFANRHAYGRKGDSPQAIDANCIEMAAAEYEEALEGLRLTEAQVAHIRTQLAILKGEPVPRFPDPPMRSRAEEMVHIAEDLGLNPDLISNPVFHSYGKYHVLTFDQYDPNNFGNERTEGRIRLTDEQVQEWRKKNYL